MITRHVAVPVGSLRKDSFNPRIALEIATLAWIDAHVKT